MTPVRLTLPLPAAALSPNARVHYQRKARIVKHHRHLAWVLAVKAMREAGIRAPFWERAEMEATFYWKTRHSRDRDNAAARLKSYVDGIADAGVLADDAGLVHLPVRMEYDAANPRVEIIIRALEEA
jgi:crossover junction endodeoxyribonuclease RusA